MLFESCVAILLLPPANEVWCKVMFLHLSVSHSVHREGVCSIACWDTPPRPGIPQAHTSPDRHPLGRHPTRQTPSPGQTPPPVRHHPPRQTPPRILRNTVNKRAVHILLECILVIFVFWLCSITEDQFVKENIKKAFADPSKRAEWIKQYQVRDKMYTGVFPKWSETFIEFSEFRESDNC